MDKKELSIILPNHLRGRSLTEKVIPTVSNLRNTLKNLEKEGWNNSRLTNWDKRSYKAYKIEGIEEMIKNKDESEKKSIIREQNTHPRPFQLPLKTYIHSSNNLLFNRIITNIRVRKT